MPVLKKTDFTGTITWLGRVLDQPPALVSHAETEFYASLAGVEGEIHAGLTRPSCSHVSDQYPPGTEIAKTRQFSVLSAENLAGIAETIGAGGAGPRPDRRVDGDFRHPRFQPYPARFAIAGDIRRDIGGRSGKPPLRVSRKTDQRGA